MPWLAYIAKMNRPWLLLGLFLFTLFLYIASVGRSQYSFERFLNTLFITFDDFPADYSKALIASKAANTPLEYDYSTFASSNVTSKIPRTIHFVWFKDLYETHPERTKIPSDGSHAPALCTEYNPDYTINIWNATAARKFMKKHYAKYLPLYDNYRYPIQQVDAFKYFVLWHYGGVYMDMDIACRRPLDPLLEFPAWFPRAQPLGVNNDLMASRAKHPVVGKMTESLEARNKNLLSPWVTIFWSTGPRFTTDVLKMWFDEHSNSRYQPGSSKKNSDPDDFYTLPPEFYSEEYTFFGHSPGGTWYGEDVAVVLWFMDHPWLLPVVGVSLVLAGLIIFRRWRRVRRGLAPGRTRSAV